MSLYPASALLRAFCIDVGLSVNSASDSISPSVTAKYLALDDSTIVMYRLSSRLSISLF